MSPFKDLESSFRIENILLQHLETRKLYKWKLLFVRFRVIKRPLGSRNPILESEPKPFSTCQTTRTSGIHVTSSPWMSLLTRTPWYNQPLNRPCYERDMTKCKKLRRLFQVLQIKISCHTAHWIDGLDSNPVSPQFPFGQGLSRGEGVTWFSGFLLVWRVENGLGSDHRKGYRHKNRVLYAVCPPLGVSSSIMHPQEWEISLGRTYPRVAFPLDEDHTRPIQGGWW